MSFKNALSVVRDRRFCVDVGDGFGNQLIEYEPIYAAKETAVPGVLRNKRSAEDN